jgi:2-polyprenyl-6-methoxyphenol hydroxylase-like FAD-dependent oxidoreductase
VAHTTWVVDKTLKIRASYVVGADGHRSMVRRTLGIPFEEVAPSQAFAVFEYEVRRAAADEMRLVLGASTVDVLWPLPGQWARWSLELLAPEVEAADRFKSRLTTRLGERFFHRLDEAQLGAILRERPSWFEPTFEDLGWSIEVRFERRLAETIGRDRVWLAGDAAHLTGPAGMQSMNAGLREAGELASCIARILRGKEDPGVLADYERRTLAEWRFLLGSAGGLRPGASTPPFIATNAARVLACLPGTGEEIDRLAGHLGLTVDRG